MKKKFHLFKIRLIILRDMMRDLLFKRNPKFILIQIDDENLIRTIKGDADQDIQLQITYLHLHEFLVNRIIKVISSHKDDIDMMLDKASFEIEAEEFMKNRK